MFCTDVRPWLGAHLDGELESVAGSTVSADVVAHLSGCASCRAALERERAFQHALAAQLTYHPAPALLRARVTAMAQSSPDSSIGSKLDLHARTASSRELPTASIPLVRSLERWRAAALAALFLVAVIGAHDLLSRQSAHAEPLVLERELVASHVRALMPGHLTDVASTDRHTVKPWFEGKLDFSPVVFDFTADGFPLIGGRLDYVAGHTAAALVFASAQHTINLFVWPEDSTDAAPRTRQLSGHAVVTWRRGGLRFGAVSTVAVPTLERFGELYLSRDSTLPRGSALPGTTTSPRADDLRRQPR